jgi:hypothetical protein
MSWIVQTEASAFWNGWLCGVAGLTWGLMFGWWLWGVFHG